MRVTARKGSSANHKHTHASIRGEKSCIEENRLDKSNIYGIIEVSEIIHLRRSPPWRSCGGLLPCVRVGICYNGIRSLKLAMLKGEKEMEIKAKGLVIKSIRVKEVKVKISKKFNIEIGIRDLRIKSMRVKEARVKISKEFIISGIIGIILFGCS